MELNSKESSEELREVRRIVTTVSLNLDIENCATLLRLHHWSIFGVNQSSSQLKRQKKSVSLSMEVTELVEKILDMSHQKLDRGEKIV